MGKKNGAPPDAGFERFQRAGMLHRTGRLQEARDAYIAAVDADPLNGAVLHAAAAFAAQVKDYEAALDLVKRAAILPWGEQTPRVWQLMGVCLNNLGHYAAAAEAQVKARTLDPQYILAWMAEGSLAAQAGDLTLAEHCFRTAYACTPRDQEDRQGQAQIAAMLGDYDRCWTLWESRIFVPQIWGFPHKELPLWTGQPARGRHLLVVGEGGLGDEIQFARFLPALVTRTQGTEITLLVKSANISLFHGYPGITTVGSREEEWPKAWRQVRMFSLPKILHLPKPKDWPSPDAQVRPDLPRWSPPEGQPLTIGYCWKGGTAHENDYDRSYPSAEQMLAPLKDAFPDAQFKNFTHGDQDYAGGHNWPLTGEALLGVDVLLSVDTAIVHFAASLGVSTLCLTPSCFEWRWGIDLSNPWYRDSPMRLIHKPNLYAHEEQMQRAIPEIKDLLAQVGATRQAILGKGKAGASV